MNWASNVVFVLLNTYKHHNSETLFLCTIFVSMFRPRYVYLWSIHVSYFSFSPSFSLFTLICRGCWTKWRGSQDETLLTSEKIMPRSCWDKLWLCRITSAFFADVNRPKFGRLKLSPFVLYQSIFFQYASLAQNLKLRSLSKNLS